MEGTRVRVEYFDQNEAFASCLPRTGTIVGRRAASAGAEDWYLLELDEPVEYQHKLAGSPGFRLVTAGHFLIRSRWPGFRVGRSEPAAVFILLVEGNDPLPGDTFAPEDFVHAAWGMCHTEP